MLCVCKPCLPKKAVNRLSSPANSFCHGTICSLELFKAVVGKVGVKRTCERPNGDKYERHSSLAGGYSYPSHYPSLLLRLYVRHAIDVFLTGQQLKGTTHGWTTEIAEQLARLREDLAGLAKSVKALGVDATDEIKAQASRVTDEAINASTQAAQNVRDEFSALNQSLTEQVQKKPLQSIGIAVAVGFLLAVINRR
jgi:ElaB/YqjD/DUF883 family membrane-anchored ribosome-binding protein